MQHCLMVLMTGPGFTWTMLLKSLLESGTNLLVTCIYFNLFLDGQSFKFGDLGFLLSILLF